MRSILSGTTAGLLVLTFTAAASAQSYDSYHRHSYSPPVVHQQYYQPYAQPYYGYSQPYAGSSFNLTTPSFGLGIYSSPNYGSGFSIYSGSGYGQSYYPYGRSGYGGHSHHHHHHHHHHR
jgi:hypothetical protein